MSAEPCTALDLLEGLLNELSTSCHKINNPLTSLLGRAQILRMKRDLDPQTLKAAEVIEDSAKRLASCVQELALLVRDGRERLAPLVRAQAAPQPVSSRTD